MKDRLLEIIVCPNCKKKFDCIQFSKHDEETESGILICRDCGVYYPIINSIPRILPNALYDHPEFVGKYANRIPELHFKENEIENFLKVKGKTKKSFGFQWTRYKTIHEDLETEIFLKKTGFKPESLKNKLALDAGCGYGRYTYVANKLGMEVVGVDLSKAVESARENSKHLEKVHIIQGDLHNLPFPDGTFDVIFSIGVIHHTPDPKFTFNRLVPLLKPNGTLSVWVYKTRGKIMDFLNHSIRKTANKLPHETLYQICWIARPLGWVVIKLRTHVPWVPHLLFFVSHKPYPDMRQTDTFDWWSPEYVHFHTEDEIVSWFKENRFKNIQVRPQINIGNDIISDVGVSGIKP